MPTPSLTREEAADRTERVHPHRCEVDLDLTGAPDAARRTFPVEVAWTFSFDRADGPDETFLDFTGEVLELEINGRSLSAEEIAAAFAVSALGFLTLGVIVALATAAAPATAPAQGVLGTLIGVYAGLPLIAAVPFAAVMRDTGLFNAWWEMVSSLTTTGASLYSADLLPLPLHLWRSMVGWMGGFFVLVAAVAILAPLRVGGFEIMSNPYGREEYREHLPPSDQPRRPVLHLSDPSFDTQLADPASRLGRAALHRDRAEGTLPPAPGDDHPETRE